MDGDTLTRQLLKLLGESSETAWMDTKTTYDYLYWSACETVKRTHALKTTQSITTIAETSGYNLNPDFLELYLMDDENRKYIKYYDGSNYTFIYHKSYESIVLANNTTSVSIPNAFTIALASAPTQITGTTTSDGAATAGECTLTDTAATFTTTELVSPGDIVHNTTDGSHGVVISVTSATALVTALFGGTNNDWTSADSYKINPQRRYQLILDPLCSTASHTVTVYYIQRPNPVYSDHRSYNLPYNFEQPLVMYAAWLYKYRDREPQYGDAYYKYWDNFVRGYKADIRGTENKGGYRVNLIKRASRSGSTR